MSHRFYYYLALAVVAGIVPLFFIDLGPYRRIFAPEVHAFGHLLFFAVLAWVGLQLPPVRRYSYPVRAAIVLVGALLLGGMIELIQPYFGRSAAIKDVWQNVLGASITVALAAPGGAPRRILVSIVAIVLFLEMHNPVISLWDRGVARIQFPVLSDFSTAFEDRRWSSGETDASIARVGERSLRVALKPSRYAGTAMRRSFGNWSGYEALEFSIYVPDGSLAITVSIRDHEHFERGGAYVDRFNRRFLLQPGWNDVTIPVADIRDAPAERQQDVSDIAEFAIFTSNLEEEQMLYLDRVQLRE